MIDGVFRVFGRLAFVRISVIYLVVVKIIRIDDNDCFFISCDLYVF